MVVLAEYIAPGWTDRGGVRDTRTAQEHKSIASAVLFDLGAEKRP